MTAIALIVCSVCCGCAGAVIAAQAELGLTITLLSYLLSATMGSALTVLLMMRYAEPQYEH